MIASSLMGRFGNHLFEYSFARIIGEYNGYDYGVVQTESENYGLYHSGSWNVDDILKCDVKIIENKKWKFTYTDVNDFNGYSNNMFVSHQIKSIKDNTLLRGIFQSGDIIEKIDPRWFQVQNMNWKSIRCVESTCYIHFRGMDYIPLYFDKYNKTMDFILYYKMAVDIVNKLCDKKMNFIIITDDIENARKFIGDYEYIQSTNKEAFLILNSSKYSILSPSTFSWWAAFLNKSLNICIAPSGWFFYEYNKNITSSWCYTNKFMWI